MAAPSHMTCANIAGRFNMNKSLTDDCDKLFALQGISWVFRKVMRVASPELTVNHREENGIFHVDIVSTAPATTIKDHFGMTWEDENHSDMIWGKCLRKSRMIKPETFIMEGEGSVEDKTFLMAKKLKDGKTDSRFLDNQLVHVWCIPLKGDWSAEMVWGFEEVEGERHYTRRAVVKNGGKVERVRLVYDYLGPSH